MPRLSIRIGRKRKIERERERERAGRPNTASRTHRHDCFTGKTTTAECCAAEETMTQSNHSGLFFALSDRQARPTFGCGGPRFDYCMIHIASPGRNTRTGMWVGLLIFAVLASRAGPTDAVSCPAARRSLPFFFADSTSVRHVFLAFRLD